MNAPFRTGPHEIEVPAAPDRHLTGLPGTASRERPAEKPGHDTNAAVEFICGRPGFPVLTAVHVDPKTFAKGRIETRSFPHPVDRKALHDWIEARQGGANIYFALNPLIKPMDKKAERTDLASITSLHVDLDPWAGESQTDAMVRIKAQIEAYEPGRRWLSRRAAGCRQSGIWRRPSKSAA